MTTLTDSAIAKLLQISTQENVKLTPEERDLLFFKLALVRPKNPMGQEWTLSYGGTKVVNAMLAVAKSLIEG
jgi:hypothetical protein